MTRECWTWVGRGQPCPPHPPTTTFVWAHNNAAWVGIVLCVFLLLLWVNVLSKEEDD